VAGAMGTKVAMVVLTCRTTAAAATVGPAIAVVAPMGAAAATGAAAESLSVSTGSSASVAGDCSCGGSGCSSRVETAGSRFEEFAGSPAAGVVPTFCERATLLFPE